MKNTHWLVCLSLALGLSVGVGPTLAQRDEMPTGYPHSLKADLHSLLKRLREGKSSPELLVQLSSTYFDLADDLLTDDNKRREAYLAGAKAAEQALNLNDNNADAHFFTRLT